MGSDEHAAALTIAEKAADHLKRALLKRALR
jgi:hypothetical protein